MKKDFGEFKEFIKGKKVGVVGIGVSNIPLINFLVDLLKEKNHGYLSFEYYCHIIYLHFKLLLL